MTHSVVFEELDALLPREENSDVFPGAPTEQSIENSEARTSSNILRPDDAGPTTAHISCSLICQVRFLKNGD